MHLPPLFLGAPVNHNEVAGLFQGQATGALQGGDAVSDLECHALGHQRARLRAAAAAVLPGRLACAEADRRRLLRAPWQTQGMARVLSQNGSLGGLPARPHIVGALCALPRDTSGTG